MKRAVQKILNVFGISVIRSKTLRRLRARARQSKSDVNADFASFMSIHKVSFPLYQNDGVASVQLEEPERELIMEFNSQIHTNQKYKHVENLCLCGNIDRQLDTVITEKDRYGIAIPSVLCKNCSLVRSQLVLHPESASNFYSDFFIKVYRHGMPPGDKFYSRIKAGEQKIELLKKHVNLEEIQTVFEIGCSSGGVIYPFLTLGKVVGGCDYDADYIQYGIEKGLNLYQGRLDDKKVPDNSLDLLILEHVLEHFLDPLTELEAIIAKVKPSKYLLIEIPSMMNLAQSYKNPIKYFQNAHTFCFFKKYLEAIFSHFGLIIIYSDEIATCILQKPINWEPPRCQFASNSELKAYTATVEAYLKFSFLRWNSENGISSQVQK